MMKNENVCIVDDMLCAVASLKGHRIVFEMMMMLYGKCVGFEVGGGVEEV